MQVDRLATHGEGRGMERGRQREGGGGMVMACQEKIGINNREEIKDDANNITITEKKCTVKRK